MTPSETLLQKLSEWRPAGEGRHVLSTTHEASGWTMTVAADQVESTGVRVWETTLRRGQSAPADLTLFAWAREIATRATGLLESLAVHEVDVTRNEALLRSKEPNRRGGQTSYYEVLLQGVGAVTLRRYQAIEAAPHRKQTAYALTLDSLGKLVDDLTAV